MALPEEPLEGRRAALVARYQDQCFLVDGWQTLSKWHRDLRSDGYSDLIVLDEEPEKIISKYAMRPSAELFFKLTPAQAAALVPQIRFWIMQYKTEPHVHITPAGEEITQTVTKFEKASELYLDDHTSRKMVEDISVLQPGAGRAYGIGLNYFNYTFDGGDIFTVDKSIKADLQLVVTSFDALTKPQNGSGPRWIDLLLRSPRRIPKSIADKMSNGINIEEEDLYEFCRKRKDKSLTDERSFVPNPHYRRIKTRIGWAVPDVDFFLDQFDESVKKSYQKQNGRKLDKTEIVNLFEDMQMDLFLEMTNYTFNFENDGRIALTIEFRASVDGALREPNANIFARWHREIEYRAASHRDNIDKLNKEEKTELGHTDFDFKSDPSKPDYEPPLPDPDRDPSPASREIKEKYRERRDKLNENFKNLTNIWRLKAYQDFLDRLTKKGSIFKIDIEKEELEKWRALDPKYVDDPATRRTESMQIGEREASNKTYAEARGLTQAEGDRLTADEILEKHNTAFQALDFAAKRSQVRDEENKIIKCEIEKLKQDQRKTAANYNTVTDRGEFRTSPTSTLDDVAQALFNIFKEFLDEEEVETGTPAQDTKCEDKITKDRNKSNKRRINFMYFGDILSHLMSEVRWANVIDGRSPEEMNVRIIAPEMVYEDASGQKQKINIADIPISLEMFIEWYRRTIIDKQKTVYYALDFIKDIMASLVYPAIGSSCMAGRSLAPITSISIIDVPAAFTPDIPGAAPEPWIEKIESFGIAEQLEQQLERDSSGKPVRVYPRLPNVRNNGTHLIPHADRTTASDINPTNIVHYIIINSRIMEGLLGRTANRAEDEADGIYHLGIGHDRGIVKQIAFNSTQMKYAAETRVLESFSSNISQLYNRFDANITAFGCPIFQNGQYVYIDPSTVGSTKDILTQIGLGGYYIITQVVGQIGLQGYSNILKCKFNSSEACSNLRDPNLTRPATDLEIDASTGLATIPPQPQTPTP